MVTNGSVNFFTYLFYVNAFVGCTFFVIFAIIIVFTLKLTFELMWVAMLTFFGTIIVTCTAVLVRGAVYTFVLVTNGTNDLIIFTFTFFALSILTFKITVLIEFT